jgi:gluconokinase
MLDKIRLHDKGLLPADYVANLGDAKPGVFDARTCRFLGVSFADLRARTLEGGTDEEILAWAESRGTRRTDDDCMMFNAFLMKRGFHDPAENAQLLRKRLAESGLEGRGIETSFDYIDADEGRDSLAAKAWEAAWA